MIFSVWNYLRGYVIIDVIGFSFSRFLNIAVHKGLVIKSVTPLTNGVRIKIYAKDFKILKSCSRKTSCHIKIREKHGLPFFINRTKKHKLFIFGIIFFAVMLYMLSSFVWLIEIEGNKRINSTELLNFCNEKGFKIGSYIPKTDIKALEKDLKNKFSDLSWITIQINGTKATIKLAETIPQVLIESDGKPSDIIAKCDGIITDIVTKKGTPLVKAGDVVSKGDTLVSGELIITEDENGISKEYTSAQADITAKLWKRIDVTVPFSYKEKCYTQNIKKQYSLLCLNKYINLPTSKITYKNYDKFTSYKQLSAGENYPLPLIIITNTYKEYIFTEKTHTVEEAKKEAQKIINKKIIQEFDFSTDILNKSFEYKKTPHSLTASATVEVIEKIGEKKLMSFVN